ncbi:hypothetical protein ACFPVS_02350 [Neisseria weixii]|uniref:Uncharacterized protein n=1 Tax=Neisseria weixii TaxID=1853276 RepID=A0A3N4N5J5_9NEIS|nr:hypothetical protein [Neisseria weixii]ATD65015.1 hypothetical protein CGZ65_06160 [Neisseria weixii]RPD90468.1 hypothetical protein EGK74_01595 [Neisseria weixii]RPD90590.1 hypothetical protein EGK75_01350 [Neisseria weixii]
MKPAANIFTQTKLLHRCRMIVDGNIHRSDLCDGTLPDAPENLISEAMLPNIRTIATLIAAERHQFNQASPAVFTEEADFFAARILVLGVRRFHLDITLIPMLKTANQRAQAFAFKHNLPFIPADIQMALHANRPANLLIIETEHEMESQGNLIANTLAFAAKLPRMPL